MDMSHSTLHRAATRGYADHGWLKSHHTFSFAGYYAPDRIHFGALRVLNDDTVAPGMGFGTHPHENMEIISIPLEGVLEHRDSMGNTQVIKQGDVQVMSAGTGIRHSEFNKDPEHPVKFLQIWVIPDRRGVAPRYDQQALDPADRHNRFQRIVSPEGGGGSVWVHQNAWFSLGRFDEGVEATYRLEREGDGVYVFVIAGHLVVDDIELEERDGLGLEGHSELRFRALAPGTEVLLMEVPL